MTPGAQAPAASVDPQPAGADALQRFEGRALGSPLRLTVRLPDPVAVGRAEAAWEGVVREFDAVDRSMSRFRDDSELMAINRRAGSGEHLIVSRRLRHALAAADRARRITGGRFDARVLDALERLGEHGAPLARQGDSGSGLAASGRTRVTPSEHPDEPAIPVRGGVVAPAAPIDLGGIGKGLALRWGAVAALAALPAGAGVLLEAGGDVVAAGAAPPGGWLVGIEDPVAEPGGEPLVVVSLERGAIATSSVRVRRWVAPDGRAVHHLLDPRTGEPARPGLLAVTVSGPDPAWAEVWTKALFLGGRRTIGDEARGRDLAAWWVDEGGSLSMTPAGRALSAWVAETRMG